MLVLMNIAALISKKEAQWMLRMTVIPAAQIDCR
jgi:hypothetical protein